MKPRKTKAAPVDASARDNAGAEGAAAQPQRPRSNARAGWAEDARRIAACGDDALLWPEMANLDDADLVW